MDALLQDFRYAFRTLRRSPGFVLAAVLTLALGIGANTMVYSVVDTLLLRPLPGTDADGVMIVESRLADGVDDLSYAEYREWAVESGAFSQAGAYSNRQVTLGGAVEPERLQATRVTASLLPMLGFRTALGRGILPAEELEGKVVVLGYDLWRTRFAGDRGILGRTVTINGAPHTVVGVMQPGIRFPEVTDLWVPLEPGEAVNHRDWRPFAVMARLAPGTTMQQADARMAALSHEAARRYPDTGRGRTARVTTYRETFAAQLRPMMLILLATVGLVLLIACANVAGLLLARGSSRQREIAVRLALGAGRGRVLRQLLTESVVLGIAGGAAGALLGAAAVEGMSRMLPATLPYWMTFGVDRRVLIATFALSVLTGIAFGLAPALQATAGGLSGAMAEGSRGAGSGRRGGRLRAGVVVAQMALSLVLLSGAGLLIRSFMAQQLASPGFRTRGILTFETSLQGARYESDPSVVAGYREVARAVAAVPGVTAVGAVSQLPIASCCSSSNYYPEGRQLTSSDAPWTRFLAVTPGFFRALEVPVVAGRVIGEGDVPGAPPVAVINEAFAKREWPGRSPLGMRLKLDPADTVFTTVVGVVGQIRQRQLTDPDVPQMYVSSAQFPWRTMSIVAQTRVEPSAVAAAVREAVHGVDAGLPVSHLRSMTDVVRERMFQPRIYGMLFSIFAAAALLLASIGLYGVVAFSVAQRTREIGVRMALGARSADVQRMVVRSGARLVALGLLIGGPIALLLARLLRGVLYRVQAGDPVTFVGTILLLASVALLASWLPARRAARLDPMVVLRSD
ncbi:MAG TPA: ABC transporter permease [Longimicrobiaceae bacterium]|nr:ABC transporter permease [Longimicrobiaceae bacterium]